MKSKELKTYNLPSDKVMIAQINAKPTGLFILLIIISLVSFVLKFSIAYGLTIILVCFVCICFMPRVTLIEFYDEYFVMHNRADKSLCVLIYYDEVKSWKYNWTANRDTLNIELINDTTESIEAFSKTIFEAYMFRFLRDKHKKNK